MRAGIIVGMDGGEWRSSTWIGELYENAKSRCTRYFTIADFDPSGKMYIALCDGQRAWKRELREEDLDNSTERIAAHVAGGRVQRLRNTLNGLAQGKGRVVVIRNKNMNLEVQLLSRWGESGVEVMLVIISLQESADGSSGFVDEILARLERDEKTVETQERTRQQKEREYEELEEALVGLKEFHRTSRLVLMKRCVETINSSKATMSDLFLNFES